MHRGVSTRHPPISTYRCSIRCLQRCKDSSESCTLCTVRVRACLRYSVVSTRACEAGSQKDRARTYEAERRRGRRRRLADDAVPSIGSRLVRSTSKSACHLFLESNQSQSRARIWPRLILCMIVRSCLERARSSCPIDSLLQASTANHAAAIEPFAVKRSGKLVVSPGSTRICCCTVGAFGCCAASIGINMSNGSSVLFTTSTEDLTVSWRPPRCRRTSHTTPIAETPPSCARAIRSAARF